MMMLMMMVMIFPNTGLTNCFELFPIVTHKSHWKCCMQYYVRATGGAHLEPSRLQLAYYQLHPEISVCHYQPTRQQCKRQQQMASSSSHEALQ